MSERLRIRHGIHYDPLFGYRCVREANGKREFIGPWTTEPEADRICAEAVCITHKVVDGMGAPKVKGDTPLGIWTPQVRS